MYIENSINEKYLRTLNLGCFPKNVLNFQESQDYFQQLVFIDYQLQLLIQNEFNGKELVSVLDYQQIYHGSAIDNPKEKLIQLINYTNSIHVNYQHEPKTARSFEENLYYITLMTNLLFLDGNLPEMNRLLTSITVTYQVNKKAHANVSQSSLEFIQYLTCRYYVLLGLSLPGNTQVWTEYLGHFNKPFSKSQVTANHWLDLMFAKLAFAIGQNGAVQLSFTNNVINLPFHKNKLSTIAFANYLLRPENLKLVNKSFKTEYSSFLTVDINECIHSQLKFPDASDDNTQVNDFINNLYESLSYVPFNLAIFKPSLSKKFLVDATRKTFQSRIVLSNLIYTLIDLNEYDEALAAFNTYIAYSEKDQEQCRGYIDDILAIIDTYSTCLIHFNPLKAFKSGSSSLKKFQYSDEAFVADNLKKYAQQLKLYMTKLGELIDLTYDDENYAGDRNPLSFLYRKYNLNVLQSDHSQFIELISKAWHAIGFYHSYLAVGQSPNQKILDTHIYEVLRNYKNSLIINSTGNVLYLFTYALALANKGELKPSLKLCKFILKKYPESFRTWNLLVLLITSFNNDNPEVNKPAGNYTNILPDNFLHEDDNEIGNGKNLPNGGVAIDQHVNSYVPPTPTMREPEKFINKALNISGLYILKHQQRNIALTNEAKQEILQLKMTQMAVLESIHGAQYMIDYIPEVFVLYHELFQVQLAPSSSSRQLGSREKWSHRPTFIDAKTAHSASTTTPSAIPMQPKKAATTPAPITEMPKRSETKVDALKHRSHNAVDKLKRLSKLPAKELSSMKRRESVSSYKSANQDEFPNHSEKRPVGNVIAGKENAPVANNNYNTTTTHTTTTTTTVPQRSDHQRHSASAAAPLHQDHIFERKLLQDIWLWTARIFLKAGLLDECEQSLNEAEVIYEPNVKVFIATGYLHSKSKKFFALQEFERSLEILDKSDRFNKVDHGLAILGLAKLFLVDDKTTNSLFVSTKDMDAAIIRLKNLLENYSLSWPYGVNNPEVWFYLSKIYEIIDDKILLTKSLWKCIDLEDLRPVRTFEICNSC
ncbi:uncharacterized protein LODBEIA_P49140 [Lodderomyces beijingensis]|uniref:Cargo-transport protein YPP1 n=1 Tax=Lodderomyces beijingensis TaxID=1775926 RepID=A0ABP0ZRA9_9ASCO